MRCLRYFKSFNQFKTCQFSILIFFKDWTIKTWIDDNEYFHLNLDSEILRIHQPLLWRNLGRRKLRGFEHLHLMVIFLTGISSRSSLNVETISGWSYWLISFLSNYRYVAVHSMQPDLEGAFLSLWHILAGRSHSPDPSSGVVGSRVLFPIPGHDTCAHERGT